MNVLLTTLKKELMSYLFSPVGYIIAVLLYLYRGLEVSMVVEAVARGGADRDQFSAAYVLQVSSFIMILIVPPILTMRCFAEERRSGSLEVLMTAPVRDWEIVWGKWLAAFLFFVILWAPTLLILFFMTGSSFLDTELAFGPVLSGYFGLALVGAMLLAAGCFTSSLTDNQLLASLAAMLINGALIMGPGLLAPYLSGLEGFESAAQTILEQINVYDHLTRWFARGLVDTSQIVFYIAGICFFLFLTTKALEGRRWK
ncbi:MAG: ABC transporter permease [Planctomycetota bacterium]|jgi:ABC-2 type transport system permease protein